MAEGTCIKELGVSGLTNISPDDYKILSSSFQSLTRRTPDFSGDDYAYVSDWRAELESRYEGTELETKVNYLLTIAKIWDLLELKRLNGNEHLDRSKIKIQCATIFQEVAECITMSRNNPEALKLITAQVDYIHAFFSSFSSRYGRELYDRSVLTGLKGTVAGMVAFKEMGAKVYIPPAAWDVHHDIDLIVAYRGKIVIISLKCFEDNGFDVKSLPFPLDNMPGEIRAQARRGIRIEIPGPKTAPAMWKDQYLGLPSNILIDQIRRVVE